MLFKNISIKTTLFFAMLFSMSTQAHPGHEHSSMEPILTAIGYGVLSVALVVAFWFSYKSLTNKGDA